MHVVTLLAHDLHVFLTEDLHARRVVIHALQVWMPNGVNDEGYEFYAYVQAPQPVLQGVDAAGVKNKDQTKETM